MKSTSHLKSAVIASVKGVIRSRTLARVFLTPIRTSMKTRIHSQSGFLDSRALLSLAMVITGIYLTVFATAKPQALTSGPARRFGTPVARYNGPANLDDSAKAAVVDGAGNVYVTGSSTGAGSGLDCVTIKYDFTGQQQWVARYNGPANLNDDCVGIAVDVSGNVFVTGSSQGSGTGYDYL